MKFIISPLSGATTCNGAISANGPEIEIINPAPTPGIPFNRLDHLPKGLGGNLIETPPDMPEHGCCSDK